MLVQQTHPAECFLAAGAAVLLALQVCLQVGPQVALVSKGAGTVCAGERFLPCVCSHVSLQQPGSGEGLATVWTLAGQGVCPYMHLQGREGIVGLVAELAGEVSLYQV